MEYDKINNLLLFEESEKLLLQLMGIIIMQTILETKEIGH